MDSLTEKIPERRCHFVDRVHHALCGFDYRNVQRIEHVGLQSCQPHGAHVASRGIFGGWSAYSHWRTFNSIPLYKAYSLSWINPFGNYAYYGVI